VPVTRRQRTRAEHHCDPAALFGWHLRSREQLGPELRVISDRANPISTVRLESLQKQAPQGEQLRLFTRK